MENILKIDHAQLVAFIATLVPAPTKDQISSIIEQERLANPHNDSYKPRLRDTRTIDASLRVKQALAIVDEVYMQTVTAHNEKAWMSRR